MGAFGVGLDLARNIRSKGGVGPAIHATADTAHTTAEAVTDSAFTIPRLIFRVLQFVFGLVVIGMYGNRVDNDRKAGKAQSAAWVYAVFVAGLSCVGSVILLGMFFANTGLKFFKQPGGKPLLPSPKALFPFDFLLFILWIAVFGTFAAIFRTRTDKEYQGTSVRVMKIAVWVDLANCIFWLITGIYGCAMTFACGKARSKTNKGIDSGLQKGQKFTNGLAEDVHMKLQTMPPVYQKDPKSADNMV